MIKDFSGINEEGIDKLIQDIYNCAENIHKAIQTITDSIDQTDDALITDLAEEIRLKYDNNKVIFQNISEKIERYNDVLLSAKIRYQNLNTDIVTKLKSEDKIKEE